MMRNLVLALLLGLTGMAGANDEKARALYRVEVIVFIQNNGRDRLPARPEDTPDMTEAIRIIEEPPELTAPAPWLEDAYREAAWPMPWYAARPGERKLDNAVKRLQGNSRYQPLLHKSWWQTVLPPSESLAVSLEYPERKKPPQQEARPDEYFFNQVTFPGKNEDYTPRMNGTITLHQSRFLHLGLDLALYGMPGEFTRALPPGIGSEASNREIFRIRQSRRISLGKASYFDHRHFGVIALVEKLEHPVETSSQPGSQ